MTRTPVLPLLILCSALFGRLRHQRRALRLDQLVEVTVDELRAGDRVNLSTDACIVLGNQELLAKAVRNLVENALRHAPGSTVVVTVRPHCVVVDDDGPSELSVAGKPIAPPSTQGSGTGLAIVEWVAYVHGAAFSLLPSTHGGMTATLTFPPPPPARDASPPLQT